MRTIDLNRIAVFAKVVEEGGFTAAAAALGLPKSSVSRAVALLEAEVGARLLMRSTRHVSLTEAGSMFYQRASIALGSISEAREEVASLDAGLRGSIRITSALDIGVSTLAPLIAAFIEQHSGIVIEMVSTSRVVDLIGEGFDLALRAGAIRDETLVARRLPPFDFALYAAPGYLEAHGTPRTIAELASHRCVLFRAERRRTTWTLRGPRGDESVELSGPVHTDDLMFALEVVVSGGGIGLLPSHFAVRAGERVVRVLPRHCRPGAPIHLVHPSGRYVPRRVAAFRDFVIGELERSAGLALPKTRAIPARRSRSTK